MGGINNTVKRETKYIALGVLVLSMILQMIFLTAGAWDYTVFLGNLLAGSAAVINFLWMGIAVQRAVECDEKQARNIICTSQTVRMFFLFAVIAVGVNLSCLDAGAVILPVFFPRIAIATRPML